jgi:hypothetical protein
MNYFFTPMGTTIICKVMEESVGISSSFPCSEFYTILIEESSFEIIISLRMK